MAGSSDAACTTMPSVVPNPSSSSFGSLIRAGLSVIAPGSSA
jgi:hypothetical protein